MPMSPRLLRPRASNANVASDTDARAYIEAVRLADGQYMEPAVQLAVNAFVVGCKADGIWSAIKASCLLMGARTLSGALTPLVGAAPTNNFFVSSDYNRKTGLAGDGLTKFLDTNRNASTADLVNNHHIAVLPTLLPDETAAGSGSSDFGRLIAVRASGTGTGSVQITNIGSTNPNNANSITFFSASTTLAGFSVSKSAGSFAGLSRSSSSEYVTRHAGSSVTRTDASLASLANANWQVLGTTGTGGKYSAARVAFYSIGESLNLALLDSRVSTLYTAIGAAIP